MNPHVDRVRRVFMHQLNVGDMGTNVIVIVVEDSGQEDLVVEPPAETYLDGPRSSDVSPEILVLSTPQGICSGCCKNVATSRAFGITYPALKGKLFTVGHNSLGAKVLEGQVLKCWHGD